MNNFFHSNNPVFTGIAPGRMDVMGGISDYSGSLLLQMPVKQVTTVQVQRRMDTQIHIRSVISKNRVDFFSIDSGILNNKNYAKAKDSIHAQPGGDWAAYIVGCMVVLHIEQNVPVEGMNILVESAVPIGKGVSSSAALEIATLCAFVKLYELSIEDTALAILAQKAENLVVGAPCGLMDQLTSYLGRKNKLLPLICQPHTILPAIAIPPGISFCAIDSGVRHAVSGASYTDVRAAAFMAYTIIALYEGSSISELQEARDSNNWTNIPFNGFLANISPSVFDNVFRKILPHEMLGKNFIENFGVSIDAVTEIVPDKIYQLRVCAEHPVRENFRIHLFTSLLQHFSKQKNKKDTLELAGELMFQSHAGYSAIGLGNEYTDEIVARVRAAGPSKNVFGARITGGGSGGTVVVLCYGKEGRQTAKKIFEEYRKARGIKSFFFSGSSEGALLVNGKI